jgi:hypothetical protein
LLLSSGLTNCPIEGQGYAPKTTYLLSSGLTNYPIEGQGYAPEIQS